MMAEVHNHVIQELHDLLNRSVDVSHFPYKKGNSIRIGGYAIRKKKSQYIVIDCKDNKIIEQCFSQTAAIALAKRLSKGNEECTHDIMQLDQKLMKHYVDCIFYSHTIDTTKDEYKRSSTLDRYDIAKDNVEDATAALEDHIFI
jgi:hypothetical protein